MKFDVTYRYFDESENAMKDGFHVTVDTMSATQGVLKFIAEYAAEYDEGTRGYEEFCSIAEVTAEDPRTGLVATAYRIWEKAFEMHIYTNEIDEAFVVNC